MTQLNLAVNVRLRWIGAPGVWDVLAVIDQDGKTIATHLRAIGDGYRHQEKMRALICHYVPRHGPPNDDRKCERLWDDIFEFKAGPRNGKKLRALWFFDVGPPLVRRRIICTPFWFFKRDEPSATDVSRAANMRTAYIQAKRLNQLAIEKRIGKDDDASR